MWMHYERLHNHNKAKHNKTECIFLGIYCTVNNAATKGILPSQALGWRFDYNNNYRDEKHFIFGIWHALILANTKGFDLLSTYWCFYRFVYIFICENYAFQKPLTLLAYWTKIFTDHVGNHQSAKLPSQLPQSNDKRTRFLHQQKYTSEHPNLLRLADPIVCLSAMKALSSFWPFVHF